MEEEDAERKGLDRRPSVTGRFPSGRRHTNLDELALAATMKAKLIPILHEVTVTVRTGIVFVNGKTGPTVEPRAIDEI
jgi:hypothetical protein